MTPRKLFITGATGFIGSRLCEMLSLDAHMPYRALVRNFSRAARIARFDPEMVAGDLTDTSSLVRAMRDCDAVAHLAHGDDKDAKKQAHRLVEACHQARVRRLVHVSSMAVHGPEPGLPIMTEETAPRMRWGETYSDAKSAAEDLILSRCRRYGIEIVVIRPTIVYGPYSGFVTPIVGDARSGHVSLIDNGRGLCNAVYVDDVCTAILAALNKDDIDGKAFLINGNDRLTWREFIETFANMVDRPKTIVDHSVSEIDNYWRSAEPTLASNVRAMLRLLASPNFHAQLASVPHIGKLIRRSKTLIAGAVSPKRKRALKRRFQGRQIQDSSVDPAVRMPSRGRVVREAYRTWVANEHAQRTLDWQPQFTFAEGAAMTRAWLQFARLI
ncbi:MAG: NAD-dependent epimerase/dehydratase family protein [Aquabacterium sp.]